MPSGIYNHIKRHGKAHSRSCSAWRDMRNRCYNKNNQAYKNYGGRGIRVDERWDLFINFYKDMGEPQKGMTLERINNNKGYSKENCKWATRKEQANNTRNMEKATKITFRGETLTIGKWAERLGIKRTTLGMRILHYGWTIEKALNKEVGIYE